MVCCNGLVVQPSSSIRRASAFRLNNAPLERVTGKSGMDVGILDRYMTLEQHGKIQAEYVWYVYCDVAKNDHVKSTSSV